MGETFPSNYLCVRLGSLSVSLCTTDRGDSPCVAGCPGAWGHSPGTGTHSCPRAPARLSGQALPAGCCLQSCSCLLHALGSPGGARSAHPPLAWHRQRGQCRQPGKSSVAKEALGSHPPPSVTPGLSLGDFQHCSFHFSAEGEEAHGRLKGINDT